MTSSKISLKNITLIAVTGQDYKYEENYQALVKSSEGIEFGAVRLIEDKKIKDINTWNKAIVYDLHEYIDTDYAILIHHDGYIINPELWNNEWLNYDYIGAPWPLPVDEVSYRSPSGYVLKNGDKIFRVGNSVSLRSKKLMELPTKLKMEWKPYHGFTNEDGFICVNNRHIFEEHGCKFADIDVAKHFSKEREIPENVGLSTFAFHQVD